MKNFSFLATVVPEIWDPKISGPGGFRSYRGFFQCLYLGNPWRSSIDIDINLKLLLRSISLDTQVTWFRRSKNEISQNEKFKLALCKKLYFKLAHVLALRSLDIQQDFQKKSPVIYSSLTKYNCFCQNHLRRRSQDFVHRSQDWENCWFGFVSFCTFHFSLSRFNNCLCLRLISFGRYRLGFVQMWGIYPRSS